MPHPGKVPLAKVTLAFPEDLYRDVQHIVRSGRRWISEADFIRHAVANEVERWKAAGHQLPAGPSPDAFLEGVSRDRAGRERKPAP
jgi:Arc/MetJ-type ribon-helix-helix transcriptional regulator